MRVEGSLKRAVKDGLPDLCRAAYGGSSWSALLVAIHVKAASLDELLRVVGVPDKGRLDHLGFNACADGYAVYRDALLHGAEL